MFFIKTSERIITREELLENPGHREYLTSITWDGESGERSYLSGVSTIRKAWEPYDLYGNLPSAPDDAMRVCLARAERLAEDPKDLAVLRQILEEAAADCASDPEDEGIPFYRGMSNRIREPLSERYHQEYCRLVWNGTILYTAETERRACKPFIRWKIISGAKLKREAEESFFGGYANRRWLNVSSVFRLRMLQFPETTALVKLKEYFRAAAELLQVKTVLEIDMHENPISLLGDPVYDPETVSSRLGTRLVEAVQGFGFSLGQNQYYEAAGELERALQLQAESARITDRTVKQLTEEAVHMMKTHMDIFETFFGIWDAYMEELFCGNPDPDAFAEYLPGSGQAENPWRNAKGFKWDAPGEESESYTDEELLEFLQEGLKELFLSSQEPVMPLDESPLA